MFHGMNSSPFIARRMGPNRPAPFVEQDENMNQQGAAYRTIGDGNQVACRAPNPKTLRPSRGGIRAYLQSANLGRNSLAFERQKMFVVGERRMGHFGPFGRGDRFNFERGTEFANNSKQAKICTRRE